MMTHDKLSVEEIEVLIEALEAWAVKDIMGGLIGMSMMNPAARSEKMDKMVNDITNGIKIKKERATLIAAKLILMKTRMSIDDITKVEKIKNV